MFSSTRRAAVSVLGLALVASAMVLIPTAVSAEEAVFEAEGAILGSNPASSDVGGATETAFLLACAVPPNQGVDGYVVELPESFHSGGAPIEIKGDSTGPMYDLDVFFYDAECAGTGSLATTSVDEAGTIPAGSAWVVVNAWIGVDTGFTLKAIGAAAEPDPIIVKLEPSSGRITHGQSVTLKGSVSGCTATFVEVYSKTADNRVTSLGRPVVAEDGTFKLKDSPKLNTTYTAELSDVAECAGGARSKRVPVDVKADIRIDKKQKCKSVVGRVLPNQDGTRATLKRRGAGTWDTVDRARLDGDSRFKLDFPHCGGHYRIVWQPRDDRFAQTTKSL